MFTVTSAKQYNLLYPAQKTMLRELKTIFSRIKIYSGSRKTQTAAAKNTSPYIESSFDNAPGRQMLGVYFAMRPTVLQRGVNRFNKCIYQSINTDFSLMTHIIQMNSVQEWDRKNVGTTTRRYWEQTPKDTRSAALTRPPVSLKECAVRAWRLAVFHTCCITKKNKVEKCRHSRKLVIAS